jgi:hypothetical protein
MGFATKMLVLKWNSITRIYIWVRMEERNFYAITSSTDDRCQEKSACALKLNNCKEHPLPKANNHLIIQMSRVCRFTQRTYPGLSPISFLVLYAFSLFFI